MDLISLHYFQELSKDLNMTKTAERLYISQQTLSNHIQRLEQYYNAPLFYRKPSLSLTCAGEFVLGFAQVMEKEERNLKDILSDIERQERGTLRVGASTVRSIQLLPQIPGYLSPMRMGGPSSWRKRSSMENWTLPSPSQRSTTPI